MRAGCVFTTHTPVPAGIDRFPRELDGAVLRRFAERVRHHLRRAAWRSAGAPTSRTRPASTWRSWACAWPAGATAWPSCTARSAGEMFAGLWPDVPVDEVADRLGRPTASTPRRWISPEIDDLLTRYVRARSGTRPTPQRLGPGRRGPRRRAVAGPRAGPRAPGGASSGAAAARRRSWPGASSSSDVAWTNGVLDPTILTIGFARRFATYKRATPAAVASPTGCRRSCCHADRPVQFVFAGKAHPADERRQGDDPADRSSSPPQLERAPPLRVHRRLRHAPWPGRSYQGADVWLNNPAAPAGGVRHERDEGGPQRRPQLLDPRRLVGRVLRRRRTAGPSSSGRGTSTDLAERRPSSRRRALFDLLRARSCPSSTSSGAGTWRCEAWVRAGQRASTPRSGAGHGQPDGPRRAGVLPTSRRPQRGRCRHLAPTAAACGPGPRGLAGPIIVAPPSGAVKVAARRGRTAARPACSASGAPLRRLTVDPGSARPSRRRGWSRSSTGLCQGRAGSRSSWPDDPHARPPRELDGDEPRLATAASFTLQQRAGPPRKASYLARARAPATADLAPPVGTGLA